ncbi:hypothetical protein HNO52_01590 [Billgrantia diversa]|uniref:COG4315 family predicted lipoprotein n=1 Tax=Halomonas sp. MCCC 1A13316 TaxID=2733487 RepID=UPI0018A537BF|nr:hypothetical protein [Halomonas sp. MCCC 1A13316]QOR37347.1 hypothetical protein HNO52_01590 [Halomonas sp. MCCC 1A13316]
MKPNALAGNLLVVAFFTIPALAGPETTETGGDDNPQKVEGMAPEESEQQLEARSDPEGRARLEVAEKDPFGRYLTNQDGKSLYVFMQDEQGGGYSTCDESCAIAWPPYTTAGSPNASKEIDAERLDTFEREDGSAQVTYDGWPLYYFARDVYPGDALGQGLDHLGGHWYLISPEGEVIETDVQKQAEPVKP